MSPKNKAAVPEAQKTELLSPETGRMLDVIIALIPAAFAGVAVFGIRAAAIIGLTVLCSVLFEHLYCVIRKCPTTVGDLSAVVTGLILSFSLPVKTPLYLCVLGSAVAIIAVKLLWGGRGRNILNPALTARAALFIAFIPSLTNFTVPSRNPVDAVSCATPLYYLSQLDLNGDIGAQIAEMVEAGELPGIINMLFGVKAGCIGEVCTIALILGGVYLILRGVISFAVPVSYLGAFTLCTLVFSGFSPLYTLWALLSGGVVLGAFFIATDPVTSPESLKKKLIYGALCGIITALIRFFTPLSEGVSAAVLLMNLTFFIIKIIPVLKDRMSEVGGRKSEETEEATSEAENEPSLVGDGVPDIPPATEETTEEVTEEATEETSSESDNVSEVGDRKSEETEEVNSEAENEPSLVGDGVPDIPPATEETTEEVTEETTEKVTEEATEEVTEEATEETSSESDNVSEVGDRKSEETEEVNPEAENKPSLVGDGVPDIPPDRTPPAEETPVSRPVLVNELSEVNEHAPAQSRSKPKKKGRKAKKKQKQMPDFTEPLPEVIPEFLKKEIEKQKAEKGE